MKTHSSVSPKAFQRLRKKFELEIQKSNAVSSFPSNSMYENAPIHRVDFALDRRAASMALQFRLGLLSERRFGSRSCNPHHLTALGPNLRSLLITHLSSDTH